MRCKMKLAELFSLPPKVVNNSSGELNVDRASCSGTSFSLNLKAQTKAIYLVILLIIVANLATYSPLFSNKFVIYDDPEYITENVNVAAGLTLSGISWAFTSLENFNWHPLTWLSHMLDVQLFGLNPAGHHFISLLIHIVNSILVLTIFFRMTGALWRSALVALLFAIHPLHVESVAWAAERKDLLCALFWFLTIRAYILYIENPSWKRYLPVIIFFALGLLSKPMIVTLPCALFLLDYWPLQRRNSLLSLVTEKVPLFLMSAGGSLITYRAQAAEFRSGVTIDIFAFMNAVQSYVTYLFKAVYPVNLAVLYPFDVSGLTILRTCSAALILLILTALILIFSKSRPYLLAGWLWYLGTLVPVIGIFRVGFHSIADRYTYLPYIGLFIIMSWGLVDLVTSRITSRRLATGAITIICGLCCVLTYQQVRRWENTITLMTHTIAVTKNNWFAYNTLGASYMLIGTANKHVNISASLPLYPNTIERRVLYLGKAIESFSASIRIYPSYLLASNNLELAIAELKKVAAK